MSAHVPFNAFLKDLLLFAKARCPAGRTLTAVKKRYRVFEPESAKYADEFAAAHGDRIRGAPIDLDDPEARDWQPVKGLGVDFLMCSSQADAHPRLKATLNGMLLFAGMHADEASAGACASVCESVLAGAPSDDVLDDDVARAIRGVPLDALAPAVADALGEFAARERAATQIGAGLGGLGGGGEGSSLIQLASEIAREVDVAPLLGLGRGGGGGAAAGSDGAVDDMIAALQRKVCEKMRSGEVDLARLCREAQAAVGGAGARGSSTVTSTRP